ncbi:MAG TPA: hypothetical protein VH092_17080, partial [Urbifossiella sp.]|nr:hypothetical protein [Urbifossiella sp.]
MSVVTNAKVTGVRIARATGQFHPRAGPGYDTPACHPQEPAMIRLPLVVVLSLGIAAYVSSQPKPD